VADDLLQSDTKKAFFCAPVNLVDRPRVVAGRGRKEMQILLLSVSRAGARGPCCNVTNSASNCASVMSVWFQRRSSSAATSRFAGIHRIILAPGARHFIPCVLPMPVPSAESRSSLAPCRDPIRFNGRSHGQRRQLIASIAAPTAAIGTEPVPNITQQGRSRLRRYPEHWYLITPGLGYCASNLPLAMTTTQASQPAEPHLV